MPSTYSLTTCLDLAVSGAEIAFRLDATPPPSEPPTSLPFDENNARDAFGKRVERYVFHF